MADQLAGEYRLLLRASLLSDASAVQEAWWAWLLLTDFEDLDEQSAALLPSLYQNLTTYGIQHPQLARLREIYRETWTENQRLLQRMRGVFRPLDMAGVRYGLVGSFALLVSFVPEAWLLPIKRVEVCIALEDDDTTEVILDEQELTPWRWAPPEGIEFRRVRDFGIAWERQRVTARIDAYPVLDATAQLYQLCASSQQDRVVRLWCAYSLLRRAPIDWEQLRVWGRRNRRGLQVAGMLHLLKEVLDVPLPAATIDSLRASADWMERLERRISSKRKRGVTDQVLRLYLRYRRHGGSNLWFVPYAYRAWRSRRG